MNAITIVNNYYQMQMDKITSIYYDGREFTQIGLGSDGYYYFVARSPRTQEIHNMVWFTCWKEPKIGQVFSIVDGFYHQTIPNEEAFNLMISNLREPSIPVWIGDKLDSSSTRIFPQLNSNDPQAMRAWCRPTIKIPCLFYEDMKILLDKGILFFNKAEQITV